ncbi:MAG: PAS domain S-box protein [Ginsengibacter sp.]
MHFEDMSSDAEFLERTLKNGNIQFEKLVVSNKSDFEKALKEFSPQIILSDHTLPSFNSIEALKMVKASGINVPFILVTATMSEEFAASIILQGGDDYILKDNLSRLPSAINRAMDKNLAQQVKIKTEQELKTAHERLVFHLENSPLGYIEWDDKLLIRSLSKKAEEIFGWNLEEYKDYQKAGFSPVYIEDKPRVEEMARQLVNGTIERNKVQQRNYTSDGRVIWCEWFNSVLKNEEGKVITIMSLVEDITEQKKAQETLINNELRFREFFETAPEALFVVDPETKIFVDYNENALKLVKCSATELLKKSPEGISPRFQPGGKRSRGKLAEYIMRTMKGERPIFDWVIHDANGKNIFCEVRLSLLTNAARPLIRISVLDITERVLLETKLVEEKLKKQQEITDAVITAQERERSFLGEELHDNINQILATSKLYLDLAVASDSLRKDLMTDCRNFTITAMEEIRKLSRSLLPPSLGEMSLGEALSELIDNIRQADKLHFIKEWSEIDESLLNENLSLVIFRIVQEQLNNVLKHAEAKTVVIGLKQEAEMLQLKIKDDGKGFDTSEKRKGIGLKNILSRADLFKGEVIINSEPGQGCELTVNFNTGLYQVMKIAVI